MAKWEAVTFGPGKEYVTLYCDGNDIFDDAPIVTEIARKLNAFDEMLAALSEIAGMQPVGCQRCEGNGRLWADGKAHYPSENLPTTACPICGGEGKLPVDLDEVQGIANDAIAKAEAANV